MQHKKDLNVWTTALPLFFELIAVNSIAIMDVFFMSLVADKAVAALGACTQIILVFTLLMRTLCGGAGAIAAQSIGAKNRVDTLLAFMYTMLIGIVFGFVFASCLYWLGGHMVGWMGLKGEALTYAEMYLAIVGPAFFLLSIRTGYTTIAAVKGRAKINLVCALVGNVINLFFNCVFVLGWFGAPKLGVFGVALATAMAHGIYLILIAYITHRYLHVHFVFAKRVVRKIKALTGRVLGIAIPNCGDLLSYCLFQVMILSIVIRYDENAAAAYTYAHQIMSFVAIWSFSVAQGQAIWTAHLVGAQRYDTVEKEVAKSILRSAAFSVPVTLLILLSNRQLFSLFTDNQDILAMIASALMAYVGIELGRAFNATLSFSLASSGDARFPAMIGITFNWLLGVPLAYVLGIVLQWGLLGALIAVAADELLRAPLNYWRLRSRRWVKT